jgi:hypothetical protein
MNHITQLTIERNGLSIELSAYFNSILKLKSYLLSDKFSVDTTVQVKDVLLRLQEAEQIALDARTEADNAAFAQVRKDQETKQIRGKANCERCGKFGYDWDDIQFQGYTSRLCRRCHSIAKHNNELAE